MERCPRDHYARCVERSEHRIVLNGCDSSNGLCTPGQPLSACPHSHLRQLRRLSRLSPRCPPPPLPPPRHPALAVGAAVDGAAHHFALHAENAGKGEPRSAPGCTTPSACSLARSSITLAMMGRTAGSACCATQPGRRPSRTAAADRGAPRGECRKHRQRARVGVAKGLVGQQRNAGVAQPAEEGRFGHRRGAFPGERQRPEAVGLDHRHRPPARRVKGEDDSARGRLCRLGATARPSPPGPASGLRGSPRDGAACGARPAGAATWGELWRRGRGGRVVLHTEVRPPRRGRDRVTWGTFQVRYFSAPFPLLVQGRRPLALVSLFRGRRLKTPIVGLGSRV